MAAGDVISIGDRLWSTHTFQQGIKEIWCGLQPEGTVGGGTVAIHSSGTTIFGFPHIDGITLGAGEE
jgi:hypothetical protein